VVKEVDDQTTGGLTSISQNFTLVEKKIHHKHPTNSK